MSTIIKWIKKEPIDSRNVYISEIKQSLKYPIYGNLKATIWLDLQLQPTT